MGQLQKLDNPIPVCQCDEIPKKVGESVGTTPTYGHTAQAKEFGMPGYESTPKRGSVEPTSKELDKLVASALEIEEEKAFDADAIGFIGRALALATLPHSKFEGDTFRRRNGFYEITLRGGRFGLPYGSVPRLILIWLCTEAVRTQCSEIELGNSLSDFMRRVGLDKISGGKNGSIGRIEEQAKRLFSSLITWDFSDGEGYAVKNILIAEEAQLWWNPKEPDAETFWDSSVTLSRLFFQEITNHPVPIDMRAVHALQRSPMAIDIYVWLTHRFSYLSRETLIPWQNLQFQLGSGYPLTPRGLLDFKANFKRNLKKVLTIYRTASTKPSREGLKLEPSPTAIDPKVQMFLK